MFNTVAIVSAPARPSPGLTKSWGCSALFQGPLGLGVWTGRRPRPFSVASGRGWRCLELFAEGAPSPRAARWTRVSCGCCVGYSALSAFYYIGLSLTPRLPPEEKSMYD